MALHIVGDDRWADIVDGLRDAQSLTDAVDARVVGFVDDLDAFLSTMDIAMLPVVVGGTGISSKIFKCIETGTPFVSTLEGNRGFACGPECRETFFVRDVHELFGRAMRILGSQAAYDAACDLLVGIGESLSQRNLATNALLIEKLRRASAPA